MYTMEHPSIHFTNFLGVHKHLGECVYQENARDEWDIPWTGIP